jgi:competence protein ComGC
MKTFNTQLTSAGQEAGGQEAGFLLIEFITVLALSLIMGSIAMTSIGKVKELATKQEMAIIVSTIVLYEAEESKLPSNLKKLEDYFKGDGYKTDSFGENYDYNKSVRTLCSVSIDIDKNAIGVQPYCVSF